MKRAILLIATCLMLSACNDAKNQNCGMDKSGDTAKSWDFNLCEENQTGRIIYGFHPQSVEKSLVTHSDDIQKYTETVKADENLKARYEQSAKLAEIARKPFNSVTLLISICLIFVTCIILFFFRGVIKEKDSDGKQRYSFRVQALMFACWLICIAPLFDKLGFIQYTANDFMLAGEKIGVGTQRYILDMSSRGKAVIDETSETSHTYDIAKDEVKKLGRLVASFDQTDKALTYYINVGRSLNNQEPYPTITFPLDTVFHINSDSTDIYRASIQNSSNIYYTAGTATFDKADFGSFAAIAEKANWQRFQTDDISRFEANLEGFKNSLYTALGEDKKVNNETIKGAIAKLAYINRKNVLNKELQAGLTKLKPAYYQLLELACYDTVDAGNLSQRYIKYMSGEAFDGHPVCLMEDGKSLVALGSDAKADYEYQQKSVELKAKNTAAAIATYKELIEHLNTVHVTMNKALLHSLKSVNGLSTLEQAAKKGTGYFQAALLDISSTSNFDSNILTQFNTSYKFEISKTDKQMINEGFVSKASAKFSVMPLLDIEKYISSIERQLNIDEKFQNKEYQTLTAEYLEEHYINTSAQGDIAAQIDYYTRTPKSIFYNTLGITDECMNLNVACQEPTVSPIKALSILGADLEATSTSAYLAGIATGVADKALSNATKKGEDGKIGKKSKNKYAGKILKVINTVLSYLAPVLLALLVASAVFSYLIPLIITMPQFMIYIYYVISSIMIIACLPALLIRLVMPNDKDNLISIGMKFVKLAFFFLTMPTLITLCGTLTVHIANTAIHTFAIMTFFIPAGDIITETISYVILAYGILAAVSITAYTTIGLIECVLTFLEVDFAMDRKALELVENVEMIFFKIIPGLRSLNALFANFKSQIRKKQKR